LNKKNREALPDIKLKHSINKSTLEIMENLLKTVFMLTVVVGALVYVKDAIGIIPAIIMFVAYATLLLAAYRVDM
jgi:hypothetical protein